MDRRTAREKALQILFQFNMNDISPDNAMELFLDEKPTDPYLTAIVQGVHKHKKVIDDKIEQNLENWTIDRIASVEKTVLRIAVYEMMFEDKIPLGVSINEAVELAKKFGEEKSGSFVNGVLSKVKVEG